MLVLSRKKNERIVVSQDVTIVIVEIRDDKVRLGIEAPADVPIHRGEVFDAIKRKNPDAPVPSHEQQKAEQSQVSTTPEESQP